MNQPPDFSGELVINEPDCEPIKPRATPSPRDSIAHLLPTEFRDIASREGAVDILEVRGRNFAGVNYERIIIDGDAAIFRAHHNQCTFHFLYGWKNHLWWQLLDYGRQTWPQWFLPKEFVVKLPSVVSDSALKRETECYRRLRQCQGRWIPRCYGNALFACKTVLLLQYIEGVDLARWLREKKEIHRAATIVEDLGKIVSKLTKEDVSIDGRLENWIIGKSTVVRVDFGEQHLLKPDGERSILEGENKEQLEIILNKMHDIIGYGVTDTVERDDSMGD